MNDSREEPASLLSDLSVLADAAGDGPTPAAVRQRLRQRRRERRLTGVCAAAAAVVVAAIVWSQWPQATVDEPVQLARPVRETPAPQPLARDADSEAIRQSIRDMLRHLGGGFDARIEKLPGQPLSFALTGRRLPPPDTVQKGLQQWLVAYETAIIRIQRGRIQYSLIAAPATGVTVVSADENPGRSL